MNHGIKQQSASLAFLLAMTLAMPSEAETQGPAPEIPQVVVPGGEDPAAAAPEPPAPETDAARLDRLFAELAEPGRDDWERIEADIARIWSRSGSESMDLLLRRGSDASAAQNYPVALEHYSALIDHAPDFAEAWNARATTYFQMGEYSLSISDIEHVLALNPRHFGALTGLAFMLEELGQPKLALDALKDVQKLNPNSAKINDAVKRLEQATGAAEL